MPRLVPHPAHLRQPHRDRALCQGAALPLYLLPLYLLWLYLLWLYLPCPYCAKALRCEALMDKEESCAAKAARGLCETRPTQMLKNCLKACSESEPQPQPWP
jgi:hypothetical protein